jgi:3-hydroxyacyl-CoA dehydrogenase
LGKIHDGILKFRNEYGDFWTPAPLLERLAKEGKTFASLQG